uniref:Uncharacterized protein n=1 Tax=Loigolactobacillus rennini TaxID=238013 RepID=A0A1K2I6N9_9LACO|nr:hypothetical protein LREN565_1166 [Loigolactobacillus rennini]
MVKIFAGRLSGWYNLTIESHRDRFVINLPLLTEIKQSDEFRW